MRRAGYQRRDEQVVLEGGPPVVTRDHGLRDEMRILELAGAGGILDFLQGRGRGLERQGSAPWSIRIRPRSCRPSLPSPNTCQGSVGVGPGSADRVSPRTSGCPPGPLCGRGFPPPARRRCGRVRPKLERATKTHPVQRRPRKGQPVDGLARGDLHPRRIRAQLDDLESLPRALNGHRQRAQRSSTTKRFAPRNSIVHAVTLPSAAKLAS